MTGYVYAIAAGDLVKIGWSAKPSARFSKIQSDSGLPCRMLGYVAGGKDAEADLHARFAAHHARGEWFRRGPEVESFIASLPPEPSKGPRLQLPGNALREWRLGRGLTLYDLCPRIGITHGELSRIERGKQFPRPALMLRIYAATGGDVTPNDLLGITRLQVAA
jgi:hypothetical protein